MKYMNVTSISILYFSSIHVPEYTKEKTVILR
jgi:hypothetical protein